MEMMEVCFNTQGATQKERSKLNLQKRTFEEKQKMLLERQKSQQEEQKRKTRS